MRPHDLTRAQLLIRFGYDGSRFRGLQPQGHGIPTAGQALKDRLTEAAGLPPKALNFAARTDAGVHALSNIATCYWRDIEPDAVDELVARLEAPRADGLLHVRAWRVPPTVHARGSGRGKRYRYLIEDGAEPAPADDDAANDTDDDAHSLAWKISPRLDVERMRRAAAWLVGTHDFSSLRGGACGAASAEKTLVSVRVGGPFPLGVGADDGRRRFVVEVTGTAFLRKMMRNLVGLLVEVGTGWRDPDDIPGVLAERRRSAAGVCAPPGGLTLVEVGCSWPEDGSGLVRELRGALGAGSAAAGDLDDD